MTQAALVPRVWDLLTEAIEAGVQCGWNRAHKHTDTPNEEHVRDCIEQAVISAICERFHVVEPRDE